MCSQQWQGKVLDKDLLFRGNKVYSEGTCIFIDAKINLLIKEGYLTRNTFLAGVCKTGNRFTASVHNKDKSNHIGCYGTEIEAHNAWRVAKAAKYIEASKLESDQRVVDALVTRANELLVLITP